METKKLTPAEKTLATMAKTVLVLGIIGSVFVFFGTSVIWQYSKYSGGIVGMDGINWVGLPYFIFSVMSTLISWSVLSILVEISVNIRANNSHKGSESYANTGSQTADVGSHIDVDTASKVE